MDRIFFGTPPGRGVLPARPGNAPGVGVLVMRNRPLARAPRRRRRDIFRGNLNKVGSFMGQEVPLLRMEGVGKAYFSNRVLKNVSFTLEKGRILGLVGRKRGG